MKILIAADGSPYTKRLLDYLAAHEDWLNGHHQFVVLNATAAIPPRAISALDKETLQSYYTDESEKVFKPIRAFLKKNGLNAEFVAKVGHAHEAIAKTAKTGKFDLIMMGSHGHTSFGSMVMGSVTAKVMAHCETPVLLVR